MPSVTDVNRHSDASGGDLSIAAKSIGVSSGDVRILFVGQRAYNPTIACSGMDDRITETDTGGLTIRIFTEYTTTGSFVARTVTSSSSEEWFCMEFHVRGLTVPLPSTLTYSVYDSTSTTRRYPASPTYSGALMPFGFVIAKAVYSNNSNWSGYFTATDPSSSDAEGSGTTGIYGLCKYKETTFNTSFASTSWTAYATGYLSISFGLPASAGPSFTRNGIAGDDISEVDAIAAVDISAINGVSA